MSPDSYMLSGLYHPEPDLEYAFIPDLGLFVPLYVEKQAGFHP